MGFWNRKETDYKFYGPPFYEEGPDRNKFFLLLEEMLKDAEKYQLKGSQDVCNTIMHEMVNCINKELQVSDVVLPAVVDSEKKLKEMAQLHKPKDENGKSDFYLAWRLCYEWMSGRDS